MADNYNEDYYNLLKQQNYEALLNKEVQLDNARNRALKQTNVGLNSMGLASSGYGQTARQGIEGQYLNALEGANQTYQNEATNIGLQEQQAIGSNQDNKYGTFAALFEDAVNDGREGVDNLMSQYELYDELGNFDFAKASELYGADNANLLLYQYNRALQGFENQAYQGTPVSAGDYQTAIYTLRDQNGQTGTMNDELNIWFNPSSFAKLNYEPQNGDVVKISPNKASQSVPMFIIYRNGNWYQTTAAQYANATNKHWFRSDNNTNKKFFFDDATINY